MRAIALSLLLTACSDYGFFGRKDAEEGGGASTGDGGAPADTGELDTGDGGSTDTGEVEVPVADAPVYANTGKELYEIDPGTGAYTLLGSFHDAEGDVGSMVDLAIDLDGHMVGANFDYLYLIDPTDAAVTALCQVDDLVMYALTFTDDGTLVAGAGDEVVAYDIENCRSAPIVSGTGYETSGDLVGLPDGYLYWTVKGEGQDGLVQVDPRNGSTAWLGDVGSVDLFGLGYDEDQLYGFGKGGEIVRISPETGRGEVLQTAPVSWYGAATNPVVWGE
jgi:hypothetical protein